MSVRVHVIESEPFAENSYVVWADGSSEAFVIDPGFEPDAILDFLRRNGLSLVAIVCTHGHVDHIAGNADLKAAYPAAPILIGISPRAARIVLKSASARRLPMPARTASSGLPSNSAMIASPS